MLSLPMRTSPASLPSAGIFFKCLEIFAGDGYGSMVDSVTGARYNPLRGNTGQHEGVAPGEPVALTHWMQNGATWANSVRPTNTVSIPLEAGGWPECAGKQVIIFACGVVRDPGLTRIAFGNGQTAVPGSDGNLSISLAGQMHGLARMSSGLSTLTSGADPAGIVANTSIDNKLVALIGEYVPAITGTPGTYRVRVVDANGVTIISDDAVTPIEMNLIVSVIGDITPNLNNKTRSGGMDFYSKMMFLFNTLPPEAVRERAYRWMIRHHAQGHRELPPHFVGYS